MTDDSDYCELVVTMALVAEVCFLLAAILTVGSSG